MSSVVTLCKHRIDGCYYAVKQISLDDNTERKSSVLYVLLCCLMRRRRVKKEVRLLSVMSGLNWRH